MIFFICIYLIIFLFLLSLHKENKDLQRIIEKSERINQIEELIKRKAFDDFVDKMLKDYDKYCENIDKKL